VAVLSMNKQEFSRLDVLLRVQSGRLRVSDACVLIGLQRRQVFRLLCGLEQDGATSLLFQAPRQTQQPPATRGGSHSRGVDRARAVLRLWPELGGGEAGRASRLFGVARDLARLDDRRWTMAGPSASSPLAASAAPPARSLGELVQIDGSAHAWFEDRGAAVHAAGFCG
jgi:hypothetical protein